MGPVVVVQPAVLKTIKYIYMCKEKIYFINLRKGMFQMFLPLWLW